LKKLTEAKKQQNQKAEKLRKELKAQDASALDKMIEDLNMKLETSSVDLKTEKEMMRTIKQLTLDKQRIKDWDAEKSAVAQKQAQHDALYEQRQKKGDEVTQLKEAEKEMNAKLDAMRNGEGAPDGVNPATKVTELMDEKSKVIEGIKAKRQELKDLIVRFKTKASEYREFQRAVQAYERKVDKIEYAKRRAENAERQEQYKEEKKQRDRERKEQKKKMEARMAAVAAGVQIYVGGLALRSTEQDVISHFQKFGNVTDCFIVSDNETRLSRGFGFVTYENDEMAQEAIKECNGKEISPLCTMHKSLSCKKAEKSKLQKEWEKNNLKKKPAKEDGSAEGDTEGEREGAKSEEEPAAAEGAAGAKPEEAPAKENGVNGDHDNGAAEANGAPEADQEAKDEDAKGANQNGKWKATRDTWVKDSEETANGDHEMNGNGTSEVEAQ